MNKLKISDSDKRLLLIFFAIVIVACSYFFIFNKGMSKAAKIQQKGEAWWISLNLRIYIGIF